MNARARYALMAEGWTVHPETPRVLQRDEITVGFSDGGAVSVTFPVGDVMQETVEFPPHTPGPAVATFCAVLYSTPAGTPER